MTRSRRSVDLAILLLVILISVTITSASPNADPAYSFKQRYEGSMIDAHAHPIQWSRDWMVETLQLYHQVGVDKVIFFDGNEALEAHRLKPNEIIPSLYVRYMNRTSTVKDLEAALRQGFMWVGEALLRHWGETNTPADDPVALQIYDLCAKYRVPITIHQDSKDYRGAYEELERALDRSPNCIFIFHGWWLGPGHLSMKNLERLIARHPNLYVELAGELEASPGPPWTEQTFVGGTARDLFAYPDGRIKEEWRNIFEKYPDRFINGFDLWTQSAYTLENLKIRVEYWRNLLGQISQDAAEKLAFRNVESLLHHRVPSEISISVQASEWPYVISVTGRINPNVVNANVVVYYVDPTGTRVRHEVTAINGGFEDSLTPNVTGDWLVHAAWEGNQELLGRESSRIRVRIHMGGIVIDGYWDDWKQLDIKPSIVDPQGDNIGSASGTDIKSVYAAMDEKYLYLMFELYDKISDQVMVQYCFAIDVNGDGKWDYQPGFEANGYAWIWNLTGGRDYSDPRNVSPLGEAEAAALDVVEFKMPLNAINSPSKMRLEPYFVIEQAGKYAVADRTNAFEINRLKDELPPTTVPIPPAETSEAWKLVMKAEEAIEKARQDGRTEGLKKAEDELLSARNAWRWGRWQEAAFHANQAMKLAESATLPVSQEQFPRTPSWVETYWLHLTVVAITVAIGVILSTRKLRKKEA